MKAVLDRRTVESGRCIVTVSRGSHDRLRGCGGGRDATRFYGRGRGRVRATGVDRGKHGSAVMRARDHGCSAMSSGRSAPHECRP